MKSSDGGEKVCNFVVVKRERLRPCRKGERRVATSPGGNEIDREAVRGKRDDREVAGRRKGIAGERRG